MLNLFRSQVARSVGSLLVWPVACLRACLFIVLLVCLVVDGLMSQSRFVALLADRFVGRSAMVVDVVYSSN